jgi:hypothetical protein
MNDLLVDGLSEFFDYIWGTVEPTGKPTYVYLPVKSEGGKWTKYSFRWPKQKQAVIRHVLQHDATGNDVYYSPALYSQSRPVKENVMGSWFLWVDFDGNAPEDWDAVEGVPHPTLIVQSSLPGHEHCYWRLDQFVTDLSKIEERNRSLAYVMSADTSGWDADQVLRPPGTTNYKRKQQVHVKEWDR